MLFPSPTPTPANTTAAISPSATRPTPKPTLTSTPRPATATTLPLPPTPTEPLPTPTPTPTPAFVFTGQTVLLYTAIIRNRNQIYALEPGGVSQLITAGSFSQNPSLSPDQTKIIVDTNQAPSFAESLVEKVILYDLQRHEILPLNLLSYPTSLFWSKDGTSLVYITNSMYSSQYQNLEDAANQLVLYDLATGENQVLVEAEAILTTGEGGWAIDNQHIAYVAKVNGQYDLFTINSDTLEIRQLSNTPDIETMILWSPTTLQLLVGTAVDKSSAFNLWPWAVHSLYLVDLANNEWQYLTDRADRALSVSWSPDGQQIIFVDMCIKHLETGDESCPLPEPYRDYFIDDTRPMWSPDMKWVAFRAYNGTCFMLYFWEVDTNRVILGDIPGDLVCNASLDTSSSSIFWSTADFSSDQ